MKANLRFRSLIAITTLLALACGDTGGDNGGGNGQEGDVLEVPGQFATIGAAVGAAQDGDTIVLGEGTYGETVDFGGKSVVIRSVDPEDPEVVAATVIDGGGTACVVRFVSGETDGAQLLGVTVTGGSVNTNRDGGGICVRDGASPLIRGNVITGNHTAVGAGILVDGASPTLEGNTFTGNQTSGRGSAIFATGGAEVIIRDNEIRENTGGTGAIAVYDEGTRATIEGNTITGNTTDFGVGGVKVSWGAEATLTGNTIDGNTGRGDNSAGGVTILGATATLTNNTITGNVKESGTGGAGVNVRGHHTADASAILTGNTISDNVNASGSGGGINVSYHASATLEGNTLSGNEAENWGGGIVVTDLRQDQAGGDHEVHIRDNTIEGNTLTGLYSGGGIAVRGPARATITGNTVSGNAASMATVSGTRSGGGIALELGDVVATVHDNVIENNSAGNRGGGIYVHFESTILDAAGAEWPRVNSPPGSEPNNTYSGNSHDDDCGEDVFFGENDCSG